MAGLGIFIEENCNEASRVDRVDVAIGDSVTFEFVLGNKTVAQMSSTVQVDNVQYLQATGGFEKDADNNSVILNSPPATGAQIVFPGLIQATAAAYDREDVPGVTNPREVVVPLWLADPTTIHLNKYANYPGNTGIKVCVTDLITGMGGASTAWCSLACSTLVVIGPLVVDSISAYTTPCKEFANLFAMGTATVSGTSGGTTITVDTTVGFLVGDYVILNVGTPTEERRRIKAINTSTKVLTFTTAFDFNHAVSEIVYTFARKFYWKVIIPENAADNEAASWYNVGLRVQARKNVR